MNEVTSEVNGARTYLENVNKSQAYQISYQSAGH